MRPFRLFVRDRLLTAAGLLTGLGALSQGSSVGINVSSAYGQNAAAWKAIGLDRAAHSFTFKKSLKVAIIDDGFDIDNPLWAGQIAHNEADIPGNGIDDDHNGKIDDYQGWDFGDNDEDVRPAQKMLPYICLGL